MDQIIQHSITCPKCDSECEVKIDISKLSSK